MSDTHTGLKWVEWLNKRCFWTTFKCWFITKNMILSLVFTCLTLVSVFSQHWLWMNGFPPQSDLIVLCTTVGCGAYCHQPLWASFLCFLLPVWPVALQRVFLYHMLRIKTLYLCVRACVCMFVCVCECLFTDLSPKKVPFMSFATSVVVKEVSSDHFAATPCMYFCMHVRVHSWLLWTHINIL